MRATSIAMLLLAWLLSFSQRRAPSTWYPLTLKSLWVSSLYCLFKRMISTCAGRSGWIVAGSCTAWGKAIQCPFEVMHPCFNTCTCAVGASLASDIPDSSSRTHIGSMSMLFSSDQTFGTLLSRLQQKHMFPLPWHSNLHSLQTSQQLNLYVICSTSNGRITQYALSSRSLDPACTAGGRSPTTSRNLFSSFGTLLLFRQCRFLLSLNQARSANS